MCLSAKWRAESCLISEISLRFSYFYSSSILFICVCCLNFFFPHCSTFQNCHYSVCRVNWVDRSKILSRRWWAQLTFSLSDVFTALYFFTWVLETLLETIFKLKWQKKKKHKTKLILNILCLLEFYGQFWTVVAQCQELYASALCLLSELIIACRCIKNTEL